MTLRRRSYGSLAVVENSAETDSVLTDPESVLTPPNICATCATCEIFSWAPTDATTKRILGLAALVSPLRALLVPAPASAVAKASAAHAPIGRRALFAAGAAGAATLTAALPAAAAGATGSDGKWAQRYDEFTGAHQLISTLWTSLAWRNCKSILYLFASTANPSTPRHRRGFRGLFHRSVWPAIQGLRGRLRREAGKS